MTKPDLMAELAEGHGVAILKDIRTGTQTVHMKPGLWRDIQKALKEKDERISQLYAENQRWQNEALQSEKWKGIAEATHGDLARKYAGLQSFADDCQKTIATQAKRLSEQEQRAGDLEDQIAEALQLTESCGSLQQMAQACVDGAFYQAKWATANDLLGKAHRLLLDLHVMPDEMATTEIEEMIDDMHAYFPEAAHLSDHAMHNSAGEG